MEYLKLKNEITVKMLTGELKTLFKGELITCSELIKLCDKITIVSCILLNKYSESVTVPKNKVYFSFGVRKQII